MLLAVFPDLREDCAPRDVRGVTGQHKAAGLVGHGQHRCRDEGALEGAERLLVLPCPHVPFPDRP